MFSASYFQVITHLASDVWNS